jgi:hypothetical protein
MSEGEDAFMKEIMDTEIPEIEVVGDEEPVPTKAEIKDVVDALKTKIPEVELREDDNRETL